MNRREEIEHKLNQLRNLLSEEGLGGLILQTVANFAWVTAGGDDHVRSASDMGVGTVLITAERHAIISTNIERRRLELEEVGNLGFEMYDYPWYRGERRWEIIEELSGGAPLGCDGQRAGTADLSTSISRLRSQLLPPELDRYRILARECGEEMSAYMRALKPGLTEFQIAAGLAGRVVARGIDAHVLLVGADDRLSNFRHPIPKDHKVEKIVMVVLCGERWGLIVSHTRIVHFGELPEELKRKHRACCQVDAEMIAASKPGIHVAEVIAKAQEAYAAAGYPAEWQLHHQGGPSGYASREFLATPTGEEVLLENQAVAWNPSITGTKSEDTFLLTPEPEIVTVTPDWPMLEVEAGGRTWQRPDILVV